MLLFEVREVAERSRLKERESKQAQEEEGSSPQAFPSELADGKEARILRFSERFLSDSKVWLALVYCGKAFMTKCRPSPFAGHSGFGFPSLLMSRVTLLLVFLKGA